MSKEKQIEEMAKDLCDIECKGMKCGICDSYGCEYRMQAEALYNAGYRKQRVGEWISNRQTDEHICNLCGAIAPVDCLKEYFYKSNFCPNCGAKMRKEDEGK